MHPTLDRLRVSCLTALVVAVVAGAPAKGQAREIVTGGAARAHQRMRERVSFRPGAGSGAAGEEAETRPGVCRRPAGGAVGSTGPRQKAEQGDVSQEGAERGAVAKGRPQRPAESDPLFDDEFDEEFDVEPVGFPDPWEKVNRGILGFNRRLDRWVLDPLTRGYRKVVPGAARAAIRRFFDNIGSVPILANDILQLRPRCAGVTLTRIVTNTTVGVVGLFDPAAGWGLRRHRADFGQTVARLGVGSGPYLVLPLLGPTTLRDGTATLVDAAFNPAFWVLGPAQQLTYGGGAGLAARDANFEALMALANSSIDYYAALRNGYYQSRLGQLENLPQCDCPSHR